jgi:biotin operon repressor
MRNALDADRVFRLARQGLNGQQIADRLGVGRAAIYALFKRHGTTIEAVQENGKTDTAKDL